MFNQTVNFDSIASSLGKTANRFESSLMSKMSDPNLGNNIGDLMMVNVEMNKWSVVVGITVNLNKEIGEAMKSAIQKS